MKIGFNAQLLSLSQDYRTTGIGLYIKNLLLEFHKQNKKINLYSSEKLTKEIFEHFENKICKLNTKEPVTRILWEQLISPLHYGLNKIDLIHCPMHVIPLMKASKLKTVATVHDLANFKFPQFYTNSKQKYLTTLTKLSAKRADHLIAVSQNTKQDLIELLGIEESKISVVHNGLNLDSPPLNEDEFQKFKQKHALPNKYLLFVGTLEPRKNIEGLLDALIHLAQQKSKTYPLVIAGPKGWLYENIEKKIKKYQEISRVIITGYLQDPELVSLYQNAHLFIYPSFYEGFGFPVLEAMANSAPVICSNNSSLPEVGGKAVAYIDPKSPENIAENIENLFHNENERKKMITAGLAQAKKFSWEKAAEETFKIYRKIAN
jgi:glycosyltransferase involved in cell wall biosynthesis